MLGKKIFAITAGIIAMSLPAYAGTITSYTTRTAFNTAVGTSTTDTFGTLFQPNVNGGTLNASTNFGNVSPGLIQPNVTYSHPVGSGLYFNLDVGGGYTGAFLDSLVATGTSDTLTVTFGTAIGAFGFDTGANFGPTSVTINFTSGPSDIISLPALGTSFGFFGFESSVLDISSVLVTNSNGQVGFDNFSVSNSVTGATPTAVPEPVTLSLVGAGFGGMIFIRRRRKQQI